MKKIFSYMILLAGVMMFTACGNDDATYTAKAPLEVSNINVLFEAEGGTGTITVNTSAALTAETSPASSWLTLAVDGNKVTATAPANTSLSGRSACIILKAGGAETKVTATQKGSIFGVSGTDFTLADTLNSSIKIPVVHTSGVTVKSLSDWLTATFNTESSEIEIVAQSNETDSPRTGYVAFETGSIKDTISIVQQAMVFTLSTEAVTMSNEGGTKSITVEHSKDVTVESSADWFTVTYKDNQIDVTVAPNTGNPRKGSFKVMSGKAVKEITVTQLDPSQMYGTYMFSFYDDENELSGFYATLTEDALTIDALGWSIPVTTNKEDMTVAIQSGSFVGKYNAYFMFIIFMDENGSYWTANSTAATATAQLKLEESEDGETTLVGAFSGVFGNDRKIGSFLFGAFSEQTLDVSSEDGPYLGALLSCYYPTLIKVAEEAGEETAKAKRIRKNSVPLTLKRR